MAVTWSYTRDSDIEGTHTTASMSGRPTNHKNSIISEMRDRDPLTYAHLNFADCSGSSLFFLRAKKIAFNEMVIKCSMTSTNADGILTDLVTVVADWSAVRGVSACII